MSISVTFNNAHRILLASEFFMARRPVLDREHGLVAHELLFCRTAGSDAAPVPGAREAGAAPVIADVHKHGMSRVLGNVPGLVHVDADALASDIFQFLPPRLIMPVIGMDMAATPDVLQHITRLAQDFRFVLEAYGDTPDAHALLPLVDVVAIDIAGRTPGELSRLCRGFRARGKTLLAENVESAEQFEICLALGFDWFRGYHFARPRMRSGKTLSPSQLALAELMALIASDAETAEIENRLKGDVSIGLNLLRLVNTPAISAHRIESLRQALMALGRNQLLHWLQVMFYAEQGEQGRSMLPLMMLAATRGRLLELIAQKTKPGNRGIADTAFTVGIMSLMDTLFSMPMEDILLRIPVVDEVGDALLHRKGYFGTLLKLAEYTEWADKSGTLLLQAMREHRLSFTDLYMLQLAAFEWSDQIAYGMH